MVVYFCFAAFVGGALAFVGAMNYGLPWALASLPVGAGLGALLAAALVALRRRSQDDTSR